MDGGGLALFFEQASGTISNNTITHVLSGIATNFFTQWPAYAPTISITGNHLSAFTTDNVYGAIGMNLSGLAANSVIQNNSIDTTSGPFADIGMITYFQSDIYFNAVVGTQLTIQGNTFTSDAGDVGMYISRRSFGDAGDPLVVFNNNTLTANNILPGSTGIYVSDESGGSGDDNVDAKLTGNTVTGYGNRDWRR